MHSEFLACVSEHVHAQTATPQRPVGLGKVPDNAIKLPLNKPTHPIGKSTNTGKNDPLGVQNGGGIAGKLNTGTAYFKGAADTEQIAHAIIDDRNITHAYRTGISAALAAERMSAMVARR